MGAGHLFVLHLEPEEPWLQKSYEVSERVEQEALVMKS